jgi:photosystem II stability/assembly factor-like uncharacterized protein
MNSFISLPALGLVFILSIGLAVVAQAAPDRLQRPSPMSASAGRSALTAIQTLPDRQVMVGDSGHILLLGADGRIEQAKVPVDVLLTAVHFVDGQQGWAVGHDGVILRSTDGGKNWQKQFDGDQINVLLNDWAGHEVDRLTEEAAAHPQDQALSLALENARFAVDDARAASAGGASRPLLDLWFRDATHGWVVGSYGMLLSTVDGGHAWQYQSGPDNPDRLHLNTILGLADGTLLVAGEGGRVYRSLDNGDHWQAPVTLGPASFYKLLALNNGHVLAMSFGGALFASRDAGASWQALASPVKAALYGGRQLADGSVLLAGQGGVVLYSDDGEHFRLWRSPSRLPLLGIGQISAAEVALIGSAGLKIQSLAQLKEQLQ